MSIDARELRIGIWVKQLHLGKYTQVDLFTLGEIADDETYLDHLMPIPLSPEMLEKCGFKKNTDGQGYDILLNLPLNSDWMYLVWNDSGFYLSNEDIVLVILKCDYLHQLQNLYFALTQTELTINL